jgi:hypothetical protein
VIVAWMQAVITKTDTAAIVVPALTFAEALESLYASAFTGRVILDFQQGVPRRLEIPNPVRLRLIDPETVLDSSH